jgi:hypothetical protein
MKKKVILCWSVLVALMFQIYLQAAPRKQKEVLFPDREHVRAISKVFFKKVNLTLPAIEKVEFFTRTETYYSAYIHLTVFILKSRYYKGLLPRFAKNNVALIEKFNKFKHDLRVDNYDVFQEQLRVSNLTFYLLCLHALAKDYTTNKLSGNNAFKLWNLILYFTEKAQKVRKKNAGVAALLTVSSNMIFFKKYKKWEKMAAKILKRISLEDAGEDVKLIL